jgi:hypothetical protein
MTDLSLHFTRRWRSPAAALLAAAAWACADSSAGQVTLEAAPQRGPNARALDIRAQVSGPIAGLRYKWFSVSGETEPQESDEPATVFTFADGATRDRVTVEVWRDGRRLMREEMDVRLDEVRARLASADLPRAQVELTQVPPYEPYGGTDTRADISGRVTAENAAQYRVVVYARADLWYRQPMPDVALAIHADDTWTTWTHTGSSYAALVVRQDLGLSPRLDVLPRVGGNIVARVIVDGVRR